MSRSKESAARFYATFKDEQALLDFFWHNLGLSCSTCGATNLRYSHNRRSRYCENFHREHATSDTLFEDSKALMTLALALWLAAENILVSGNELAKLTGASPNTGWFNLKKVAFFAVDLMDQVTKSPSEWFEQLVGRRSLETPRNQHPRAEIQMARSAATNDIDNSEAGDPLQESESSADPEAQREAPSVVSNDPKSPQAHTMVATTVDTIRSVHQRISRKIPSAVRSFDGFRHTKAQLRKPAYPVPRKRTHDRPGCHALHFTG